MLKAACFNLEPLFFGLTENVMPGDSELVESRISRQENNQNSLMLEEQMSAPTQKRDPMSFVSHTNQSPPVGKNVVAEATTGLKMFTFICLNK